MPKKFTVSGCGDGRDREDAAGRENGSRVEPIPDERTIPQGQSVSGFVDPMATGRDDSCPDGSFDNFVGTDFSQPNRQVLQSGLRSLARIRANRAWEDWLAVYQAFRVLTEKVIDELKAAGKLDETADFRTVDTAKGAPFQLRFLPRWERYEALLGGNHEPLTKVERSNLRELVRRPEILTWYNGLSPPKQRRLTHPNTVVVAWKAANREASDEAKTTLAAAQQRIITEQDNELAEAKRQITALQAAFDDHDWNRATEMKDKAMAFAKMLRNCTAKEQAAVIRTLADSLDFSDIIALLTRRGGRST